MSAGEDIVEAVASWPGVTLGTGRFGSVRFDLGRREIGHLHGDSVADLPFPRRVHDELIAAGRAREHRWVPDSGWVSRDIGSPADAAAVIALFRMSYERARAAAERRQPAQPTV